LGTDIGTRGLSGKTRAFVGVLSHSAKSTKSFDDNQLKN